MLKLGALSFFNCELLLEGILEKISHYNLNKNFILKKCSKTKTEATI